LGTFLGIRIDGRLVAMVGERMKPANCTEITAVCVHPDHRGRGYAQVLLAAISRQIVARGEIPFQHVFSHNESAIARLPAAGNGNPPSSPRHGAAEANVIKSAKF
jgi:Predicted acetyltransferase